jgi:hypothetical protein
MPIVLENLSDLQEYVSTYALCPILYRRDGLNFTIAAGKIAWEGQAKTEQEADKLEAFLIERGAMKVKGYKNNEVLFG